MRSWTDITNKAMLGSSKSPLNMKDTPQEIFHDFDVIDVEDKEENFLRLSSLVYQLRQAGVQPLKVDVLQLNTADDEQLPYCTGAAMSILSEIIEQEHVPFLKMWLALSRDKKQLVFPEMIPTLFEIAERRRELKSLISETCGKRGQWLASLNPEWSWLQIRHEDPAELWQNGKLDERKELVRELRIANKAQSVLLLQSAWPTEGLNEKLAFLEIVKVNPGSEDLWLESLKEKSQKVNAAIQEILKSIPDSSIVKSYKTFMSTASRLKSEKTMLGIASKTRIEIQEHISFPEELLKTGIEKLSSDKSVSDQQFIFIQLIATIPPAFWNHHLEKRTEELVKLFQKEKDTALYLPAIALAAIKFSDMEWMRAMLDHGDQTILSSSIPSLIEALPDGQKDFYARKFFNDYPHEMIRIMSEAESEVEWSVDLAKMILRFTANDIHHYSRNFYKSVAPLVPIAILGATDSLTPQEESKKSYWRNQSEELTRLLNLKKQLLQSFNA